MRRSLLKWSVALSSKEEASRFVDGWRMNFVDSSANQRSPWHHAPLETAIRPTAAAPRSFNFLNEIPMGQSEKLEVATKLAFNPIVQDRVKKSGALRVFNVPGGIPFNYGCFPQTWEDPSHVDPITKCRGDCDPLDVVELSGAPMAIGSFTPVRVLGVLALIDEGETDWKILTLRESLVDRFGWNRLRDVPADVLQKVTHWFRYYKTFDGKPENEFAFGGVTQGEEMALGVIEQCSSQYRELLAQGTTNSHGLWIPSA